MKNREKKNAGLTLDGGNVIAMEKKILRYILREESRKKDREKTIKISEKITGKNSEKEIIKKYAAENQYAPKLIDGKITKLTTFEIDDAVLAPDSKFREVYGDRFDDAYAELWQYLAEMVKYETGYFRRWLITNEQMREVVDETLRTSKVRFVEFANMINGQDVVVLNDEDEGGQSFREKYVIIVDNYAPRNLITIIKDESGEGGVITVL